MSPAFLRAGSVPEALDALAKYGEDAKVIAGGTALVIMLQEGFVAPECLVGVGRIESLRGVREETDELVIGAATTLWELETSPVVRRRLPLLVETLRKVATVRIRSMATLGGNLSHGDPRLDPATLLLALGASVSLEGPSGRRRIPLEELFVDELTTALADDELLVAVHVPHITSTSRVTYRKLVGQTVDDYGIVNVGALVALDADGRCSEARLTLGAVASTPIRVPAAEAALRGTALSESVIAEAAELARAAADPVDDLRGSAAFKRDLVAVEVRRALESLASDFGGTSADTARAMP